MPVKAISSGPILAGIVVVMFTILSAEAAPSSADRSPAKVADATQVRPVAATDGEDDGANCSKSRKRLWLEGEGWVVRKVTTCR